MNLEKDFERARQYAKANFLEIEKKIQMQSNKIKYLIGESNWLGRFSPNLLDKETMSFKKGKKLVDIKPNEDCEKIILDASGKLLYMRDTHKDPKFDNESYYRVLYKDYEYYLYCFDGNFATYGASFRAQYDKEGRLVQWIYFDKGVEAIYDYKYYPENRVICNYTYNGISKENRKFGFILRNKKVINFTVL